MASLPALTDRCRENLHEFVCLLCLLLLVWHVPVIGADSSVVQQQGQCLAFQSSWAKNLTLLTGVKTDEQYEVFTKLMAQMLSLCTQQDFQAVRPIRVLSSTQLLPLMRTQLLQKAEALSGSFKIQESYMSYFEMHSEVMMQLDNRLDNFDIWHYDGSGMVDMAESAGGFGFVDLKPFTEADNDVLQWNNLHPYFRQVSSVYQSKTVGMPIVSFQGYLFYRRDIFAKYNVTVPVTWDEYIQVAKQLNGTDFNGDGTPDYSLCVSSYFESEIIVLWGATTPNFIQTKGGSHGFQFDPITLEPLINTAGTRAALQVMMSMLPYISPHQLFLRSGKPAPATADFNKCAMAIHTAELFKASWQWPKIKGQIGTAMVPGTTQVLDRTTMQLVPCQPDLCSDTTVDVNGNTVSINRAPFSGLSTVNIALNPHINDDLKPAAWKVIAALWHLLQLANHRRCICVHP